MPGIVDPSLRQIAIIGYAARLPQADTADAAWDVFTGERSTITRIRPDRWTSSRFLHPNDAVPGTAYTDAAGQLDDVWDFDASAFGISPREAMQMDPQHRLLLEVTSDALDAAGVDPARWDRDRTGVFIGASSSDHSNHFIGNFDAIDAQFMLGNTLSIMSNRIAYQFDAHGPSYTVDTACSSSFYALNNAVRAIREGEIDTAIVGAVSVILSPINFVGFSRAAMLSPDGMCKPFDAGANGYVRSEGAIVFVIRRGSVARGSGDRVRGIIEAAEINSDGRTTGLSLPSADRQTVLLNRAMERSGIAADDLAFIEAHGTGTAVGDPVEATAIGTAIGRRREDPILIGSAKSNFGHLEPASGMLGLLKAQMALEKGLYPATINHETPNPNIDFDGLNIAVADTAHDLPKREKPWAAGINSFGFGGANAHVVIRQPSAGDLAAETMGSTPPQALILTAATEAALSARAADWATMLKTPRLPHANRINSANHRAPRLAHRLIATGADVQEIAQSLTDDTAIERAQATGQKQRVGFVFAGNGAQFTGMALPQYKGDPAFRDAFDHVAAEITAQGGPDVVQLLHDTDIDDMLDTSTIAQPMIYAVQVALVSALAETGIVAHAVCGHSLGEVAASWAAGALSLTDATHLVLSRSRALEALAGTGGMAAVMAGADALSHALSEFGAADITLSADNSPRSSTISGPIPALDAFAKFARKRRIAVKRLPINYPYHSPAVDVVREQLHADLIGLKCQAGKIPYFSATRGREVSGLRLDAEYWWDNARGMVRFRSAVEAMADAGCGVILEIGPRPVLKNYVTDSCAAAGAAVNVVHSLNSGREATRGPRDILVSLVAAGADVDDQPLFGTASRFSGDLPAYPWERVTYRAARNDASIDFFGSTPTHPLLGARLRPDDAIWTCRLDPERLSWLNDHVVNGRILLPATAMVEIFLAAGTAINSAPELADFEILAPVEFKSGTVIELRTAHDAAARQLRLSQRQASGGDWHPVAVATLRETTAIEPFAPMIVPGAVMTGAELYPQFVDHGLTYGDAFALVSSLTHGKTTATATLNPTTLTNAFCLDPTIADAAMHGISQLLDKAEDVDVTATYVPVRIGRVRLGTSDAPARHVDITLTHASALGADIDMVLRDEAGETCAVFEGLSLTALAAKPERRDGVFWIERAVPAASPDRTPLTLNTANDQELSDGAVILDAMAHRIAWDLATEITEPAEGADDLWHRIRQALIDSGAAEAKGAHIALSPECPWPALSTLVAAMVRTAPDWAPTLQTVLRLPNDLRTRLKTGPKTEPLPVDLTGTAPRNMALWNGLPNLLQQAAITSPLIIGPLPAAIHGQIGAGKQVTLTHPDPTVLAALRLVHDSAVKSGSITIAAFATLDFVDQHDATIIVDMALPQGALSDLQSRLTARSKVIKIDAAPNLFDDLIGGQSTSAAPRRAQSSGDETKSAMVRAGFEDVTTAPLDSADIEASVTYGSVAARDEVETAADENRTSYNANGDDLPKCMAAIRDLLKTEDALVISHPNTAPGAGMKGLARVLTNELPDKTIALEQSTPTRICPFIPAQPIGEADALRLTASRGALGSLGYVPVPRRAPEDTEVEIAISASGLNFRDVMWAQGLLPREALEDGFAGASLGMECAGRILRAGSKSRFRPGDRVMAFAPHALSSHVTLDDATVMEIPDGIAPEIAAGLPTIFATAEYALADLARLSRGETVLIHGGAGGVGLAATQVAQRLGAKVIATAGTVEKRAFLNMSGIDTVFDSRSTDFADQVMEATGGTGVDVVLNSLAGEAQERTLECVAAFGRFVEIGKRDFFANSRLSERPFRNNIAFFGLDMDQLLALRPDVAGRVAKSVHDGFTSGAYTPLPCTIFAADAVQDAFRHMQRSGHIGKVILKAPTPKPTPSHVAVTGGSWLITGGTTGFGYATAEWLVDQGVTDLWLISRSGTFPALAIEDFARRGVTVHIRACDVSQETPVKALMDEIAETGLPLRGIVHGAMRLCDGMFVDQDPADWEQTVAAKLTGAMHLDRHSRHLSPAHFILYSSITTHFGNPGQAGYVTANTGLEALARDRVAVGLPALAVAWGPISDTGVLARNAAQRDVLSRQLGDTGLMTSETALGHLGAVLSSGTAEPVIGIAPMDWSRLAEDLPVLQSPLFARIDLSRQDRADTALDLAAELAGLDETAALRRITDLLRAETSEILRQPAAEIDPYKPLTDMGFDSLMAVNLRMAAEEKFDVKLPLLALADGMTLSQLARRLRDDMTAGNDGDQTTEGTVMAHVASGTDIDAVLLEEVRAKAAGIEALKETING